MRIQRGGRESGPPPPPTVYHKATGPLTGADSLEDHKYTQSASNVDLASAYQRIFPGGGGGSPDLAPPTGLGVGPDLAPPSIDLRMIRVAVR